MARHEIEERTSKTRTKASQVGPVEPEVVGHGLVTLVEDAQDGGPDAHIVEGVGVDGWERG